MSRARGGHTAGLILTDLFALERMIKKNFLQTTPDLGYITNKKHNFHEPTLVTLHNYNYSHSRRNI